MNDEYKINRLTKQEKLKILKFTCKIQEEICEFNIEKEKLFWMHYCADATNT